MVRLYAEYMQLSNYGKSLNEKAKELSEIYNDMYGVVQGMREASWSGKDYSEFFNNYISYLNELKKVIEEIQSFGNFALGKIKQYDSAESTYNSKMGMRS